MYNFELKLTIMAKTSIAFPFILEQLYAKNPITKPMFGAHGVYVGNKIICILRSKETFTNNNGIWVASLAEYHDSLKETIPVLRRIEMFDDNAGDWLIIPVDKDDFETHANTFVDLVLHGDPRIGKVSKAKFLREIG